MSSVGERLAALSAKKRKQVVDAEAARERKLLLQDDDRLRLLKEKFNEAKSDIVLFLEKHAERTGQDGCRLVEEDARVDAPAPINRLFYWLRHVNSTLGVTYIQHAMNCWMGPGMHVEFHEAERAYLIFRWDRVDPKKKSRK